MIEYGECKDHSHQNIDAEKLVQQTGLYKRSYDAEPYRTQRLADRRHYDAASLRDLSLGSVRAAST